jgi:hypothetical protein
MLDKTYPDYRETDPVRLKNLIAKSYNNGLDFDDDYLELAQEIATLRSWNWTDNNSSKLLYLNKELIQAIDTRILAQDKVTVFNSFTPPAGETTLDDFIEYTRKTIARRKTEKERFFRAGEKHKPVLLETGNPHSRYLRGNYAHWSANVIAERTISMASTKPPNYVQRNNRRLLVELLTLDFRPWGLQTNYAQEVLLLNEWLYGDARALNLSFLELLEEYNGGATGSDWDKLRVQVNSYSFIDHVDSAGQSQLFERLLRPLLSNTVISYFGRPKKYRHFILSQDRQVLAKAIVDSSSFSGRGYPALEEYIGGIKRKLGIDKNSGETVLSGQEILLELEKIFYQSGQRLPKSYNPDRSRIITVHVFASLLSKGYFHQSSRVWTRILTQLASSKDEIKFEDFAAFLFAISYPTSWLRGSKDNFAFVLAEMMKEGVTETLDILSDIVLTNTSSIPTGAEWRRALGTVDFSVGTIFLLPLIVKNYNDKEVRAMPEALRRLRADLSRCK